MTCDPRELAREALLVYESAPDAWIRSTLPAIARAVLEMSDKIEELQAANEVLCRDLEYRETEAGAAGKRLERAEGLLRGMEFIEHREDGNVWCSYCDSSADIPSALLHRYGWCVVPRIARYFEEGKRDGNE